MREKAISGMMAGGGTRRRDTDVEAEREERIGHLKKVYTVHVMLLSLCVC